VLLADLNGELRPRWPMPAMASSISLVPRATGKWI